MTGTLVGAGHMTLNKSEFLFSWSSHSKDGGQTMKRQ